MAKIEYPSQLADVECMYLLPSWPASLQIASGWPARKHMLPFAELVGLASGNIGGKKANHEISSEKVVFCSRKLKGTPAHLGYILLLKVLDTQKEAQSVDAPAPVGIMPRAGASEAGQKLKSWGNVLPGIQALRYLLSQKQSPCHHGLQSTRYCD